MYTFYSLLNVFMKKIYLLVWISYHTQHQELFLALSTNFYLCILCMQSEAYKWRRFIDKKVIFFLFFPLQIDKIIYFFYFISARMKSFCLFYLYLIVFHGTLFNLPKKREKYSNNSSKFENNV